MTAEDENVAVSAEPLGTVAGVQLLAVFQSLVGGLDCHTELPAMAGLVGRRMQATKIEDRQSLFMSLLSFL